jgi:tRNA pseudouridine38-40 synthase
MRNIRLTLAYDGSNYVGWQIQPNGSSIQSTVREAIKSLTGETANLIAAGRTDAGVHALGQVANFKTNCAIPLERIHAGLQNFLPDDIVVRQVDEVAEDFHATYSAKNKRYRYIIQNSRIPDPFLRRYAWRYSARLDSGLMYEAAQRLLGTHDFRSFESEFPNKATSVRTVQEAVVRRSNRWQLWSRPVDEAPANEGEFIWFDIVADGFLYNMVRAIVGTLVKVGQQKWTPDDMTRIIENQSRAQAGETAPPQGLYLVHVDYE